MAAKQKASEINEKYAKTFKEEYGMEFNVFVEKRENKHSILDETVPLS
ncbi:hypothetical protein J5TS2_08420 [Brevibacillus halotolerans]|nr:hypothetical protein J5TS2_08420 [Brevibacillus halotolerans]